METHELLKRLTLRVPKTGDEKPIDLETALNTDLIISLKVNEIKKLLESLPPETITDIDIASARVKLMCALQGFINRGTQIASGVEEKIANELKNLENLESEECKIDIDDRLYMGEYDG